MNSYSSKSSSHLTNILADAQENYRQAIEFENQAIEFENNLPVKLNNSTRRLAEVRELARTNRMEAEKNLEKVTKQVQDAVEYGMYLESVEFGKKKTALEKANEEVQNALERLKNKKMEFQKINEDFAAEKKKIESRHLAEPNNTIREGEYNTQEKLNTQLSELSSDIAAAQRRLNLEKNNQRDAQRAVEKYQPIEKGVMETRIKSLLSALRGGTRRKKKRKKGKKTKTKKKKHIKRRVLQKTKGKKKYKK